MFSKSPPPVNVIFSSNTFLTRSKNMHNQTHHRLLLLLAVVLTFGSLFTACSKNDFEDAKLAKHDAEFAFPLFTTTISLQELMFKVLNDTLSGDTLLVNPDQTMTLIYTGDVAEKPATDIFKFLTVDNSIPFPDTIVNFPIQAPDGVVIREALLKAGQFQISGFNSGPPANITLEIPQMVKDGKAFTMEALLPTQVIPPWKGPLVDVKGYQLKTGSNDLTLRYYSYDKDGVRIKLEPGFVGFPFLMSFFGLEFSYLEGYWGYSAYPLTRDTIEIDINQTNLDGNVTVKNPKVTMIISNSWGFPTRGVVKYLSFLDKDNKEYPLESSVFNNDSIDFNWPDIQKNEIGQTKYTYVTLDENNSNIKEIFNAQPTKLVYEVEGVSNARKDPNIIGFLTDSSTIKLGVKVELLLEGSAKNFGADQTLDLDFGDYANLDSSDIQEVEFKLVAENSTPISTEVQIYFQDETGKTLDSLFASGPRFIMEAAPVNSQGITTTIKRTENFIPMSIERFNVVRRAKKALMHSSFTTSDGGTVPVKLLATNKTTVKMGLKIKTRY